MPMQDRLDRALSAFLAGEAAPDRRLRTAWAVLPQPERDLLADYYRGTGTTADKAARAGCCRRIYFERIHEARYHVRGSLAVLAELGERAA